MRLSLDQRGAAMSWVGRSSERWRYSGSSQRHLTGQQTRPVRPYDVLHQRQLPLGTVRVERADATGCDEDDEDVEARRMRLEAVLLLAKSPLSTRKLAQLARLDDGTEARTMVRELNRLYDSLGRAVRVESVAGGYRLMTRPAVAPWLARLGHLPAAVRLSSPMMETLAVVAYRQPVSRADVEAVRGVSCGELLRQLMERDLIRIAGRSEELGRPYLYGSTKRFLQLFGLSGSDALPAIDWQALQDDLPEPDTDDGSDLSPDHSSTSPQESVVSTAVAPVSPGTTTDPEDQVQGIVPALDWGENRSDFGVTDAETQGDGQLEDAVGRIPAPAAAIEDEEDDLYEGNLDDDEDDDEVDVDDDDFGDDWEEDDDVDEEEDDDEGEEADDDEDWS